MVGMCSLRAEIILNHRMFFISQLIEGKMPSLRIGHQYLHILKDINSNDIDLKQEERVQF